MRSLSLLFADQPGVPAFTALSQYERTGNEFDATMAVDHAFARPRLTPGVELGVQRPAWFGGTSGPLGVISSNRTVTITDTGQIEIGTSSAPPQPTFFTKLTLRWDLQRFSVLGEALYAHDPNRTTFVDSITGMATTEPANPSTYGFNVLVQARF